MTKEQMRIYQAARRTRIRGGGAITTVAGLAELYRGLAKELDERMGKLERWREFHEKNHDWEGYHRGDDHK